MPRSPYSIAWYIDPAYERSVKRRALSLLVRRTLEGENVLQPRALSVAIVSDATVRDLNQRFRGIEDATDVLSFPLACEGDPDDDGGAQVGEVVISFPTAESNAAQAGHSVNQELAHLLVHGILHILGYEHESRGDAQRMRAREDELLGRAVH